MFFAINFFVISLVPHAAPARDDLRRKSVNVLAETTAKIKQGNISFKVISASMYFFRLTESVKAKEWVRLEQMFLENYSLAFLSS